MLDRQVVAHINMTVSTMIQYIVGLEVADYQSTWPTDSTLLYTAGGLDGDRSHHLELINTSSGKLAIGHAIITGIKPKKGYVLCICLKIRA